MSLVGMDKSLERLDPVAHRLPNGVQLNCVRAGSGPALVFIHGAMGDWRSWAPQWEMFTAHFDCVSYSRRYSFPNHNLMPSPDHSALVEAQDLLLLLDVLGLERCTLVGSSYGGFTALALAVQHPQRVQAVVAVEPPMMKYAQTSAEGRAIVEEFRSRVIEPANAAFRAGDDVRAARLMTGGINGSQSSVMDGEAMTRRLQNIQAMKMLALSTDEFPWLAPQALAALPMPVMLLSGQQTQAVHRAIFEQLCLYMPQALAVRIPDAGHGVSREQPAAFNGKVLQFLGIKS